ncbi:kinase-like domain-containing protein [Melanogaster broomeanus]|nr:kinase-like domain-containing protein [Melanogaster broomeanus]
MDRLSNGELFWSKRYNFFLSKGYTLRVRYSPTWVPSWHGKRGTDALPRLYEDHVKIVNPDALDATSHDGTIVFIKKIYSDEHPSEEKIALYFSSEDLRNDPANHCVPIIDNFEDEEEQNIHYIVMPILRPCTHPSFETVAEVLDFMKQVLQGLRFMHDNRVSHGDCVAANIMMDAKYLCPYGWHPIATEETRNLIGNLYYKNRTDVEVIYYFIDFGHSTLHPHGQTRFITGPGTARDKEVPEFKFEIPYDPFKTDVFILGHMFQTEFLEKYGRLEDLEPLIRLMTAQSPDERPTAEDALKSFERICNIFSTSRGQRRLRGIDESDAESVAKDVAFAARHSINHIWS